MTVSARRSLPSAMLPSPADADPPASVLGGHDDRWAVTRSLATPDALAPFVAAGLLTASDVLVATTLARRVDETDPVVLLGAALAVRAPRRQHVCVDLTRVVELLGDPEGLAERASGDPTALPWPEPAAWREALAASPLVTERPAHVADVEPEHDRDVAPLVLAGDRLYLDRLFRDERLVARALTRRAGAQLHLPDPSALRVHLDALFDGEPPDRQRLAAACAALRRLTVIAGGPGTGKTTTVARLLALLDDQARDAGQGLPSWALAAPTGKAAARLTESLTEAAEPLARRRGDDDVTVERLRRTQASTLHRLLGVRADHRTRFRHDRRHPIAADVVVVDETSMVSLTLIARLLEAVRDDARLILLGDPDQLASVEAGSVLADLVGPRSPAPAASIAPDREPTGSAGPEAPRTEVLRAAVGAEHLPTAPAERGIDAAVVVLDRVHRFGVESGIARVARAIRDGDPEATIEAMTTAEDVGWIELPEPGVEPAVSASPTEADLRPVRDAMLEVALPMAEAADRGDALGALAGLDRIRVLCAPRGGPLGVASFNDRIERWLVTARGDSRSGPGAPGRPIMVTANDRRLGVANGDVGVSLRDADGRQVVAFPSAGGAQPRLISTGRLPGSEPVHAMTIHKSQGSQFDHVVVVLPGAGSPLATRELFYTALTRGRSRATIVGTRAAVRAAVQTQAVRASGLDAVLRPPPGAALARS